MKRILVCGTKEKSLSRILKKFFEEKDFKVFLFSRKALLKNQADFFKLDLCNPATFKNILTRDNIEGIIFSQDSGTAFGNFDKLSYRDIDNFINSKILGSILFSRFILEKVSKNPQGKIKLIWTCGSYNKKPKNYLLYHVVNSAIKSFVEEINIHYSNIAEAYYLLTPFMGKTTIGILYNKQNNSRQYGEEPEMLIPYLEKIMSSEINPGVVITKIKNIK